MKLVISELKNHVSQMLLLLMLSLPLLTSSATAQQDINTRQFTLSQINFEGLKTIDAKKAKEVSGLQIGQTVMLQSLRDAGQRMLDSGLFRQVKFNYKYQGNDLEATFVIEETVASLPVLFDNFAWFSDEELTAAIRKEVPNFEGKATEGGEMIETIRRALDNLLRENKLSGVVEADMSQSGSVHVFRVANAKLPVCELNFEGADNVEANQLRDAMKEIFTADYSREVARLIARETAIPIYQQKGFLKAKQKSVRAQVSKTAGKCQGKVTVLLAIEEGLSYKWNAPQWSGNQLLTADLLSKQIALKPGDVADGLKIRKGINQAMNEYSKRGYMGAQLNPKSEFDDAAKTVTFSFMVEEGPQYRVGELTLKGFNATEGEKLKAYWQTLIGKPYDDSVLQGLANKLSSDPRRVTPRVNPDHQARVVNFMFEFQ